MRKAHEAGTAAALEKFKVAGFLGGQWQAAKDLGANLRGGLGGAPNPRVITDQVPPHSMDLARGTMRQEALGNIRTLLPSLAVGGGLYALHRHGVAQRQQQEMEHQQAQAQLASMMGGPSGPMM